MNKKKFFHLTLISLISILAIFSTPATLIIVKQLSSSVQAQTIENTEETTAEGLFKLGQEQYVHRNFQEAKKFFQDALSIYQQINDNLGIAKTLNRLGRVYWSLEEYEKTEDYYLQSLDILEEREDIEYLIVRSELFNNFGELYKSLDDKNKAIEYYQKSLDTKDKLIEKYKQSNYIQGAIEESCNKSVVLINIGEILQPDTQAIETYQQAFEIAQENYNKAIEDNQQSNTFDEKIKNNCSDAMSYALNNIGEIYQNLGEEETAINYYSQALGIKQTRGNDPYVEGVYLANIAFLLTDLNQIELAIIFFKQSVNKYEDIRINLSSYSQEQYLKDVNFTYRNLAELLLESNRVLEALKVLDLLKVQEVDLYFEQQSENTDLGIKLRDIEQQFMSLYYQQIIQPIHNQQTVNFNQFLQSQEIQNIIQQLNSNNINNDNESDEINIKETLQRLEQNGEKVAIFYPLILNGSREYGSREYDSLELILITADNPPIHRTVNIPHSNLEKTIEIARNKIYLKFKKNPELDQLYQWLIQPIKNDLDQAGIKTIIYAPDGQLRYLPLSILHDGDKWLIERYRFNNITALSLNDLAVDPQNNRQNPQNDLSIFAGAFSEGNNTIELGNRTFNFRGLPYTEREVRNIQESIPNTEIHVNQEFNRPIIQEMNNYRIVHLATHSMIVPGNVTDSFIVFGKDGEYATISEMETWELSNVELVVLSACETGIGYDFGLEILGLGYQMQRQGAQATLASLWRVNDESTHVLMNEFYKNLQKEGITKAEALKQAQISLIRNADFSNPYYWGAFILIGNGF